MPGLIGARHVVMAATLAFASGFALHAYLSAIERAKETGRAEGVVTTIVKTVKVADATTTKRLQQELAESTRRADALQAHIDEARRAQDADPVAAAAAVACRLPDGLRDQVNAALAADQ